MTAPRDDNLIVSRGAVISWPLLSKSVGRGQQWPLNDRTEGNNFITGQHPKTIMSLYYNCKNVAELVLVYQK